MQRFALPQQYAAPGIETTESDDEPIMCGIVTQSLCYQRFRALWLAIHLAQVPDPVDYSTLVVSQVPPEDPDGSAYRHQNRNVYLFNLDELGGGWLISSGVSTDSFIRQATMRSQMLHTTTRI